jgi:hypothetical protein
MNFHENQSGGNRAVPSGPTDMTKPVATYRNFADAPKNAQTERSWVGTC